MMKDDRSFISSSYRLSGVIFHYLEPTFIARLFMQKDRTVNSVSVNTRVDLKSKIAR